MLTAGRIAVITPLPSEDRTYLFVARQVSEDFREQIARANGVLNYRALLERAGQTSCSSTEPFLPALSSLWGLPFSAR